MPLKRFVTEEQLGFAVGYTAAFVVDNFVKVSAIRYGYKTVSWIASKTKISSPTGQVLFERKMDTFLIFERLAYVPTHQKEIVK